MVSIAKIEVLEEVNNIAIIDKIKKNFSILKNPLFVFKIKFSLKYKTIKTKSEIPNISGFKAVIEATSMYSNLNCVLDDVVEKINANDIENKPK